MQNLLRLCTLSLLLSNLGSNQLQTQAYDLVTNTPYTYDNLIDAIHSCDKNRVQDILVLNPEILCYTRKGSLLAEIDRLIFEADSESSRLLASTPSRMKAFIGTACTAYSIYSMRQQWSQWKNDQAPEQTSDQASTQQNTTILQDAAATKPTIATANNPVGKKQKRKTKVRKTYVKVLDKDSNPVGKKQKRKAKITKTYVKVSDNGQAREQATIFQDISATEHPTSTPNTTQDASAQGTTMEPIATANDSNIVWQTISSAVHNKLGHSAISGIVAASCFYDVLTNKDAKARAEKLRNIRHIVQQYSIDFLTEIEKIQETL